MDERTTVIHVRDMQDGDIYIGRANRRHKLEASVFGNPFVIGKDGDRERVIEQYRQYILREPTLLAMLPQLKGKRLACWCAPERCHGDVLVQLIDGVQPKYSAGDIVPLPDGGRYIIVTFPDGNQERWVLTHQVVYAVQERWQHYNHEGGQHYSYWLVGTAGRQQPLPPGERLPSHPVLAADSEPLTVVSDRWVRESIVDTTGDANWKVDTGYRPDPDGGRRREDEEQERRLREHNANPPVPQLAVIERESRGRPAAWRVIEGGKKEAP